jgi:branched-chain amino acid transport system permease protein
MILVGYCSFRLSDGIGGSFLVAWLALVVSTASLNYPLSRYVFQRLRSRGSPPSVMLVGSLGVMILLVNFVSLCFGDGPYRPALFHFRRSLAIAGGHFTVLHITLLGTSLLVGMITCYAFERSSLGIDLRAIASDETLAKSLGMNLEHIEVVGTWLGLVLSSISIIFMGLDVGLTPSTGFQLLIPAVTASVIGGVGNVKGAFAAAFIVGVLQQGSAAILGVAWQDAVLFAVLLAVLFFKPDGLLGDRITSMRA